MSLFSENMFKTRLVAALAFLFSCQSSTSEETTTTTSTSGQTKTITTTSSTGKKSRSVQHIVQRTHPFSSSDQQDFFRLALHGDAITTGEVEFTITTLSGQKIHEERFPAAALEASMVYEMKTPKATLAEREAFILKRMEEFFHSANFVTPAINAGTGVATSKVKQDVWQRIKANPRSIGFKYLLGKEDGRLLAYDQEQQKAVRYGGFGG